MIRRSLVAVSLVSLAFGCAHTQQKAPAKDPLTAPEEVALTDAFKELVGWVGTHQELLGERDVPICAVLGDIGDPSPETIAAMRKSYPVVQPASQCPFKERAVLIVAADKGEMLDDGRLIAHAGFSLGAHNGMSWAYRLKPGCPVKTAVAMPDKWCIDAKLESRNEMPAGM